MLATATCAITSRTYLTTGQQQDEGLTGLVVRQPHAQQESGVDELLLDESQRLGTAVLRAVWWWEDVRLAAVLFGWGGAGPPRVNPASFQRLTLKFEKLF